MKLVLIEWMDSHSGRGWQELDKLKTAAKPLPCRSVGWLISERNGHKVIVPHLSGERDNPGEGCGEMVIPTKVITKITVLRHR